MIAKQNAEGIGPGSSERCRRVSGTRCGAFTIIEVLSVISIIALLVAMLLPGLAKARAQAGATVCRSNIRQIALANGLYAQESGGVYVAGAPWFRRNLHRWHGVRDNVSEVFDGSRGPLVPYLGLDAQIRRCPTFHPEKPGFETGNGGYGYNNAYVGVQTALLPGGAARVTSDLAGVYGDQVRRPGEAVMFTDAAFAAEALIEYSFAEPRFHPEFASRADPSVHFRHEGTANVAWCDGHVSAHRRTFTWSSGLYPADPDRLRLGWFGKCDDNRAFDVR